MDHSTNDRPGPPGDDPDTLGRAGKAAKRQDLKATEDSIRSDLRRLATVEATKRGLDPGDPRVDELSDEAVDLAERIHRQTVAERQLSDDID